MNNKVRIQDDLYHYVNGEWLKTAKIPSDMPFTGGFMTLNENVEKTLMEDFRKFAKGELTSDVEMMDHATKFYKKALDVKAREEAGIKPVLPLLEKIKNIKDINEFNSLSGELIKLGIAMPIKVEVSEDFKNSTRYALCLMDPDIILPDTTYYDNKMVKKMILGLYSKMLKKLLAFTPLSKTEQKQYIADTIAFDDLLRQKVKSQVELADYIKLYNPMDLEEVSEKLSLFDLKGLIKQLYDDKFPKDVVIAASTPKFIDGFKEIFNEKTFKLYLHWAYVKALISRTPYLSIKIGDIAGSYMRALMGVKKPTPVEKRGYRLTSSIFSEPIGVYYGRKYFGEDAKKDIREIVVKVIDTYKLRMERNTFLLEETKQKAIAKLSKIKIKVGYPDDIHPLYKKFVIEDSDSFYDAIDKIKRIVTEDNYNRLLRNVDPNEWAMPGHMVNACYDPFKNEITFPAAILQKPFYDLHQSVSENLGGIGAVIGHEISHAFDNNGAHLDENGNLNDWWKEEDFKKFEELTKLMVEQFDGIPLFGKKVNGTLIVSENIADNGGVGVTLEIMHSLKDADFKLYFINWGRIWCFKAKDKMYKLMLTNDVHAPSILRANIAPRNFQEWYDAFDVKSTDKMYIPEDKRISIW